MSNELPEFKEPEFKVPAFEPPSDPFATDTNSENPGRWSGNSAKSNTNWARIGLLFLLGLCILNALWLSEYAWDQYQTTAQNQLDAATVKASTLVNTLETDFLKPAEQLVQKMHDLIQHDAADLNKLHELVLSNQYKLKPVAFGVAYKPFAFAADTRLYAPFYKRQNQNYKRVDFVNYDYTRPPAAGETYDSRWFVDGLKKGGWQEPYFGQSIKQWIAEYSMPVHGINQATGKEEVIGIVYADFSLEEVRSKVRHITLDNLAYGYLVSPQGILVSHPAPFLLGKPLLHAYNLNLVETYGKNSKNNQTWKGQEIVDRVAAGENFIADFADEATGQTSLVVHQKVPQSNWSFGIVMPKDHVYAIANNNKKSILWAAIALALVVVLSLIAFRQNTLEDDQMPWMLSILTSILALFVTVLTLTLFWDDPSENSVKLFSVAETQAARGQALEQTLDSSSIIPTGLLINSIEFPQPGTAAVGGILWQKYALDDNRANQMYASLNSTQNGPSGVIWPDAKLGSEKMTPLQEYEQDGMHIKSWRFNVEIALNRDIRRFPFDMSEIQLRMRALPESGALLVPDFEGYDILIPEIQPGVDESIDLTYWNIRSSFFSVDISNRKKYSGTQIADQNKNSEIIFRIQMARQSHVTLISYFLPIFIGSIMMFIVLMIPSDRSPGSVFSTLSYGGTIFFVISIFHVNLRNSEGIDSFTYLESYYIMQHILVMLISLNGFLLMRGDTPRWAQYRNNLIPKTLYWPSLSLFLAGSTMVYFL